MLANEVTDKFLIEVVHPLSSTFRPGMVAFCQYTSLRKDFRLTKISGNLLEISQGFGCVYRAHLRII